LEDVDAEQKKLFIAEGCQFFKDGGRKHRYVGIYGDRRTKRILRRALRWAVSPYPKRQQIPAGAPYQPTVSESAVPDELFAGAKQVVQQVTLNAD
jgi:hypothetical protein